ncbi:MAG: hypothetical protein IE916_00105 [Epsilonproteobacteria bacterium]|nr:hypothetical protein [Campylobacterota bacterium]
MGKVRNNIKEGVEEFIFSAHTCLKSITNSERLEEFPILVGKLPSKEDYSFKEDEAWTSTRTKMNESSIAKGYFIGNLKPKWDLYYKRELMAYLIGTALLFFVVGLVKDSFPVIAGAIVAIFLAIGIPTILSKISKVFHDEDYINSPKRNYYLKKRGTAQKQRYGKLEKRAKNNRFWEELIFGGLLLDAAEDNEREAIEKRLQEIHLKKSNGQEDLFMDFMNETYRVFLRAFSGDMQDGDVRFGYNAQAYTLALGQLKEKILK